MQDRYYAQSPYNLVRIILGKSEPQDNPKENVYTRAANSFRDWRRDEVLKQDPAPAVYRYTQRFTPPGGGAEVERQGFIALGKIEDYSAGIVFRHEQTLSKPKADRLDLLRATKGHFGQIFMLYSDPSGEVDRELAAKATAAPDVEVRDEYGVLHQLWMVRDPSLVEQVRDKMRDKKLIIADGHHRYETALNYRNERRAAEAESKPASNGELAPYDFVMITFVNMDSSGLVVLPTHRVVHGLNNLEPDEFRERAKPYYSVEEVDPEIDAARAGVILAQAGRTGSAFLAIFKDRAFLLDRGRPNLATALTGQSLRQQALDVVQLHKCLLEGVLKLSEQSIMQQENIRYIRSAEEAIAQVRGGSADLAFLMNPVRMKQVRDIAFAGEVLPQKSTDFYPKLLSGLTIYALE
jgi:uncharacterized protein (DUF1015 family)